MRCPYFLRLLVCGLLGVVNAYAQDSDTPTNKVIHADGYTYEFQSAAAPDLSEWMHKELAPVVQEWYPKLVKMLPSDGYEAPTNVTIRFRTDMRGTPASASGNRINCNADWF
jgi:hypothetical protein